MKPESNRPITIEDLLRLKRAERPPAEFWASFDRQLRAKQLAALVGKRPWWQNPSKMFSVFSRYRIPLGAGAVLAVTFFSVRDYHSTSPVKQVSSAAESIAISDATPALPSNDGSSVIAPEIPLPSVIVPQPEVAIAVSRAPETPSPRELSRVVPLGDSVVEHHSELLSPSARHTAANLAVMQSSDPVSARSLLAGANGFESRVMPARSAVEPLQQMTPPGDTRRARLSTAMVSTASLESSVHTAERAANRIAEDQLYDRGVRRLDARADRLKWKM